MTTTVTIAKAITVKLDKTEHPADGSPRWIVSGEHGRVVYDVLGNHLALLFTDGEVDSMCKRYADQVAMFAKAGKDKHVFVLLADHYRTQLVAAVTR